MKTYWRHRCTIAYLAATDRRWRVSAITKLTEAAAHFVRYSKGGALIDEHHWISRPRACAYYRQINYVNQDLSHDWGFTKPAIINFDW